MKVDLVLYTIAIFLGMGIVHFNYYTEELNQSNEVSSFKQAILQRMDTMTYVIVQDWGR